MNFGEHPQLNEAIRTEITNALRKYPRLCSSDTQLMMRERYETVFQIYDHDQPGAPSLAPMLLHPAENSSAGGLFQQRVKDYMAANVLKYTGDSFSEFMKYPREKLEIILKECHARQAQESQHAKGALGQLPS